MNVTPIQNQNYKQNTPSFKMNITFANDLTKEVAKADYTNFVTSCHPEVKLSKFGAEEFDFNAYWKSFQDAFKKLTHVQNDEGLNNSTVEVCLDKVEKNHFKTWTWMKYRYTDENGIKYEPKDNFLPTNDLLKDELFDENLPFSSATRSVLASISDRIAHSGVGYGEANKVSKLFDRIISTNSDDITELCEVKIHEPKNTEQKLLGLF